MIKKTFENDSQPNQYNLAHQVIKYRKPNTEDKQQWLIKELRRIHFSGNRIFTSNNQLPGVNDDNFSEYRKLRAQIYRVVKGQILHNNFDDALRFIERNEFPNVHESLNQFMNTEIPVGRINYENIFC